MPNDFNRLPATRNHRSILGRSETLNTAFHELYRAEAYESFKRLLADDASLTESLAIYEQPEVISRHVFDLVFDRYDALATIPPTAYEMVRNLTLGELTKAANLEHVEKAPDYVEQKLYVPLAMVAMQALQEPRLNALDHSAVRHGAGGTRRNVKGRFVAPASPLDRSGLKELALLVRAFPKSVGFEPSAPSPTYAMQQHRRMKQEELLVTVDRYIKNGTLADTLPSLHNEIDTFCKAYKIPGDAFLAEVHKQLVDAADARIAEAAYQRLLKPQKDVLHVAPTQDVLSSIDLMYEEDKTLSDSPAMHNALQHPVLLKNAKFFLLLEAYHHKAFQICKEIIDYKVSPGLNMQDTLTNEFLRRMRPTARIIQGAIEAELENNYFMHSAVHDLQNHYAQALTEVYQKFAVTRPGKGSSV